MTSEERKEKARARAKAWGLAHPGRVRARAKAWAAANPDRVKVNRRAWNAKNWQQRAEARAKLAAAKKTAKDQRQNERLIQQRAAKKEYYEQHRDKVKARSKSWRENNHDRYVASKKDNRAHNLVVSRKWAAANRPKVRATSKKSYAAHSEARNAKTREWQKANPLRVRLKNERRNARKLGVFVEDVDLDIVYERDKGICYLCHLHVDRKDASREHVIPVVRRGAHSYDNVRLAHKRCNSAKGTTIPKGQPKLWQVIPAPAEAPQC